jgi:hypothetical protein
VWYAMHMYHVCLHYILLHVSVTSVYSIVSSELLSSSYYYHCLYCLLLHTSIASVYSTIRLYIMIVIIYMVSEEVT